MRYLRTLAILATLAATVATATAQVHVRGYTRSDGTYVAPHWRSTPDGDRRNNWSTQGNVNPFTGQPGTRQPDSYTQQQPPTYPRLYDTTPPAPRWRPYGR